MKLGSRMTKQKKVILDVVKNTNTHPTADWIYEQARKTLPDISLGTVYRNLNVLKELGEISELNYGSSYSRYDGNSLDHYHFVCVQCGKVLDVDLPIQTSLNHEAENLMGVQITNHRLEFYGICNDCQTKN